jgi:hypothetical protein
MTETYRKKNFAGGHVDGSTGRYLISVWFHYVTHIVGPSEMYLERNFIHSPSRIRMEFSSASKSNIVFLYNVIWYSIRYLDRIHVSLTGAACLYEIFTEKAVPTFSAAKYGEISVKIIILAITPVKFIKRVIFKEGNNVLPTKGVSFLITWSLHKEVICRSHS